MQRWSGLGRMGWGRVTGWAKSQGLSWRTVLSPEEASLRDEGRRGCFHSFSISFHFNYNITSLSQSLFHPSHVLATLKILASFSLLCMCVYYVCVCVCTYVYVCVCVYVQNDKCNLLSLFLLFLYIWF